jgi:hypothetical protein
VSRTARLAVAFVVLALLAACPAPGVKRTPLQIAELTYVQGSVFYEAAMTSLQSLRAQRRVSDEQWTRIAAAQKIVQQYGPQYSQLLASWRATGSKPVTFEATERVVRSAADDVALVLAEVQQ